MYKRITIFYVLVIWHMRRQCVPGSLSSHPTKRKRSLGTRLPWNWTTV